MNAYLRWNNALAARFFNQEMAGRSVYLYVNQKLISDMERDLAPEAGAFLTAMQDGPPWATREGICQCALQAFTNWRARELDFPPYIAYLGFFVLAGGTEGDFAPHAYYPRLRQLLADPGEGMVPSFQRMWQLWEDLDTWSVLDKGGEFGIFHARNIGAHVHIGYPLAQTMLTEHERKALPQIFYEAGLDPTSNPPTDELARVLRNVGAQYLQPRTLKLLTTRYDADLYRALLDTAAEELAEWDGEVEDLTAPPGGRRLALAGLRICLAVDFTARKATAVLRCRLNREFPEEGLLLNLPGRPAQLRAEECWDRWSFPLQDFDTGEAMDASGLNWSHGLTMKVETLGWQLRLQGRPIRLFVNGVSEGLPGLVEVHALPQGQPFFIGYLGAYWPQLERWATSQCRGFDEKVITQGLPTGWRLAEVAEALSDALVRGPFPFLSFPAATRLRLLGGIRSSRGNNFFAFAPPTIALEGAPADLEVRCNGQPLAASSSRPLFTLPPNLPTETKILVEAMAGESALARQSLFLTGDFGLRQPDVPVFLDRFGFAVDGSDGINPTVTGAITQGEFPEESASPEMLLEDLKAVLRGNTGFLIGRFPGQVLPWPAGSLPTDWRPVWAITMKRRRGNAIFVGESLDGALPGITPAAERRSMRAWKRILWYWRKRINPPDLPPLRTLWKQFQEAARRV